MKHLQETGGTGSKVWYNLEMQMYFSFWSNIRASTVNLVRVKMDKALLGKVKEDQSYLA